MKLTRDNWLQRGLQVLAEFGPEHLKIDKLCAHLKVTKGSFYHHFGGREDYVDTLLAYWQQSNTEDVISAVEAIADLHERSDALSAITQSIDGGPENAIRAWACYDGAVAKRLAQVDQARIDYLVSLVRPQLRDPDQANLVAKTVYAHLIGVQQLGQLVTKDEWRAMDELLKVVFIAQPLAT